MLAFQFLFFSASVFSAFAIPTQFRRSATPAPAPAYAVLEQSNGPPAGFISNGPADPQSKLKISIGLKSSDTEGLEKALLDVSTPGSEKYGKHLTRAEVESFAGPTAQTKTAIVQWLQDNGINAIKSSSSGEFISFNTTVSSANALFQTQYNTYTQEATGKQVIQTLSVSVPVQLQSLIEVVYPGTQFPLGTRGKVTLHGTTGGKTASQSAPSLVPRRSVPQRNSSPSLNLSSACDVDRIDPDCLLALYGIPSTIPPQNQSQIIVIGPGNAFPQEEDLSLFLKTFRTDIDPSTTSSLETIDVSQNAPEGDNIEATLDVQYTVGLVGDSVPVRFLSVGDDITDGDLDGFSDMLIFLLAEDNPPAVLTMSFGGNENVVIASHAHKFCNLAMQLGSRGTSIFISTGDGGVGGSDHGQSSNCTTFVPTFPSNCPYVTSVGGTQSVNPEIGGFFSSGGFSDVFPRPSYQDAAVTAYLKTIGTTYAGLFNNQGRAFPDVAAQGLNMVEVIAGEVQIDNGTSFSAPIVASVIAAVNAVRMNNNKSSLGFLNPLIYSNPSLFTDITSGSNPGCNTTGFPATIGWDPVTGLGTPLFDKFNALP